VIAPATLPEGYEFEVEAPDGTTFQVQVPMGGVKQGQAFSVPSILLLHLRHAFQEMAFLQDIGVMVYVVVASMDYAINIVECIVLPFDCHWSSYGTNEIELAR